MTKTRPQILSLNGAEVDRETIARSDSESYANKAQVFENALPALKGGMFRAPGSRMLGYAAQGPGEDLACTVRTWRFSRTQAFTIEMSPGKIRLIFGTGFVQVGGADASADAAGWVDNSTGGATAGEGLPDWTPVPTSPPSSGGGGYGGSGGGGSYGKVFAHPSLYD